MSFGGAFVHAGETRPHEGTIVQMALENSFKDPIIIDALVVHNDADGFGVMFIDEGDEVVKHLVSILQPLYGRHNRYGQR